MNKKEVLENILGKSVERTSFLGYKFYVWDISHRKAINLLLKNGFAQARNPNYIVNRTDENIVIYKKAGNHKNVFIVQM